MFWFQNNTRFCMGNKFTVSISKSMLCSQDEVSWVITYYSRSLRRCVASVSTLDRWQQEEVVRFECFESHAPVFDVNLPPTLPWGSVNCATHRAVGIQWRQAGNISSAQTSLENIDILVRPLIIKLESYPITPEEVIQCERQNPKVKGPSGNRVSLRCTVSYRRSLRYGPLSMSTTG